MNKTLGEVAYDAYCSKREWKSVRGEPLPSFMAQSKDLQDAWEAAGKAVSDAISLQTGRG